MQDIYSNYYKKILFLILYPSLKTKIMKRPFLTYYVKSVNSTQWGENMYNTFRLMKSM